MAICSNILVILSTAVHMRMISISPKDHAMKSFFFYKHILIRGLRLKLKVILNKINYRTYIFSIILANTFYIFDLDIVVCRLIFYFLITFSNIFSLETKLAF